MNRTASRAAQGPRYETRFRNGAHCIFDTVFYAPVDTRNTAKAADARAAELNARPRPARKGGPRK